VFVNALYIGIDTSMLDNCWIGIAEVRPVAGNDLLEGGTGAFVRVIGIAEDPGEFYGLVRNTMAELSFELLDLDDVGRLSETLARASTAERLRIALADLSPANPVVYGTFHSFRE
jgi:hypothetical protein